MIHIRNPFLYAALTWVLFVPIPILNGAVREWVYSKWVDDTLAHQISTGVLSVIFLLFSYVVLRQKVLQLGSDALLFVGGTWVSLTVIFEFNFGHYIEGIAWQELMAEYTMANGSYWLVFLLLMAVSPFLVKVVQSI